MRMQQNVTPAPKETYARKFNRAENVCPYLLQTCLDLTLDESKRVLPVWGTPPR